MNGCLVAKKQGRTEWLFTILEKLEKTDHPGSHIKYLADRLTGLDINASLVKEVIEEKIKRINA
jgi:hypothetical protein